MKEVYPNRPSTLHIAPCRLYMTKEEQFQYMESRSIEEANKFALERMHNAKQGNHSKQCILQF